MGRADWERAAAIYLPLAIAAIAGLLRGRRPRQFAACLLSLLWTLLTLLIVQRLNIWQTWWSFPQTSIQFLGMPVELFLGWSLLWGLVPQLAFPNLSILASTTAMIAVDCMLMPLCTASVHLGPHWLVGEAIATALALIPALCIARWTQKNHRLKERASMQVLLAGMLFLFLIPELCFALRPGAGWAPLLTMSSWSRQIGIQFIFLLAIPGINAVMEFAERGHGTPIPHDPPTHLVTSGIYRYCANPMQLSCAAAMLAWSILLKNGWLVLAAFLSITYSAGIAEWDEREDLQLRFGDKWKTYRASVHNWLPRWRPYHAGSPAILYIARSCEPCTQLRSWLEARKPLGLQIIDAETLPSGSIHRMRYEPGDGAGSVEGIRAMGRALEHLHLGWAIAGATIRLPGLWQSIQLLMDASGLGPRRIQSQQCEVK
jgi:protein-S-isoprenylcysteine O-methyltransferase Ste14